jgi:hypothetical protein
MKNKLLLPHRFKFIGLMILVPALLAGFAVLFLDWQWPPLDVMLPEWMPGIGKGLFQGSKNNFTDELALSTVLLGMLIMSFSAEKEEDEFIKHTRLESLQWAVLINYILLIVVIWLMYNDQFWYVMILSMLTIPGIFLVRFHWVLNRNSLKNEEEI